MEELLRALDGATNVKSIKWDASTELWEIEFYKGEPNTVSSQELIDFLENA